MRSLKVFSLFLCFVGIGCRATPGPDKSVAGAILGAGWGAGAGATIGNQLNDRGPGAAIGAGFGAANGLMTGIALDVAEGTELQSQRELDALKVQVAANDRHLLEVQDRLDAHGGPSRLSGQTVQIFFDPDRASLRLGSATQLERFAEALRLNPFLRKVEVRGHSDDTGDSARNLRLSEARAKTIETFLITHGVPRDRIETTSYGSSQPLVSNCSPAGKQLNRRAEILVIR